MLFVFQISKSEQGVDCLRECSNMISRHEGGLKRWEKSVIKCDKKLGGVHQKSDMTLFFLSI